MWELDYKESWVLKNWCFWTVVMKTLESPLDHKEIQPVHSKGDQSWVFIGRNWCWSLNSNPLATWCKELTHWKRPWCWESLKAGGEGDDRDLDGWMTSPTPRVTQTHVHWVRDAIQLSHPLLFPSPQTFKLSQHQGLFKWVSSSHQVAKGLEFQLQHQSFQWIFRTDFL